MQDGLYALRRANKNRRLQLHKATKEKKNRIINSEIPNADYTRNTQKFKTAAAALSNIFDEQGNQLRAITEADL